MKWTEEGGARRRRSRWLAIASYASLTTFLTVFLLLGMFGHSGYVKKKKPRFDFPDFDRIQTFTRVLSDQDVNLKNTHNRVIFIGDVHGMNESLHELLVHLSYKPTQDTIVFAGDLLAKSTHASSLSVLDFLTHNHTVAGKERIFPVRGNHDQLVVQWRAWREWFQTLKVPSRSSSNGLRGAVARVLSLPDSIPRFLRTSCLNVEKIPMVANGLEFLHLLEAEWAIARLERDADPEEYVEVARKRAVGTWREEWWKRIPEPGKGKLKQQWRLFGDHYWLARDMAEEHASYLNSLPVVVHIPQLHMFVAHAGLLPSDPKLDPTDRKQPLAHIPVLALSASGSYLHSQDPLGSSIVVSSDEVASLRPSTNESALRMAQETALLTDVPSNKDAWSVQNMRSVRKSGKVSRIGDKGTPWSKLWNKQMKRCIGFDTRIASDEDEDASKKHKDKEDKDDYDLPCRPSSVVYGHAATRGLDVKRWSMGLDTGCLYGRRLTALVLKSSTSGKHDEEEEDDDEDDTEDGEDDDDEDDDEDLVEWTGQFDDEGEELDLRPRRITFGDKSMHIDARLESIKCPVIDFNNS